MTKVRLNCLLDFDSVCIMQRTAQGIYTVYALRYHTNIHSIRRCIPHAKCTRACLVRNIVASNSIASLVIIPGRLIMAKSMIVEFIYSENWHFIYLCFIAFIRCIYSEECDCTNWTKSLKFIYFVINLNWCNLVWKRSVKMVSKFLSMKLPYVNSLEFIFFTDNFTSRSRYSFLENCKNSHERGNFKKFFLRVDTVSKIQIFSLPFETLVPFHHFIQSFEY